MKKFSKRLYSNFSCGLKVFDFITPIIKKISMPFKCNKYSNIRPTQNNITYDSISEMIRHKMLCYKQCKGEIKGLERQVRFKLGEGKSYIADFVYYINDEMIVEDVKSPKLEYSKIFTDKRKLMKKIYGIDIRIISPFRLYKYSNNN